MPNNPRRSSTAVLPALVLALAAGCGQQAPPPPAVEAPQHGGTLVIGSIQDMGGVNELVGGSSQFSQQVLARLFLRLLEEQPDFAAHPPTFAPQLAASYSWSEDHRVATFELRADATWSDGVPVTAEDVRWTWQAQTDPALGWGYSFAKERITDVEVVGPHTVRFHFSDAYSSQLTDANEGFILPRHAWSALPLDQWRSNSGWFLDHLVTDGPFRLADWKPQEQIVLERNGSYFEPGLPLLDRVVLRIVPDKSAQIIQLQSGDLDFVDFLPADRLAEIESDPDLRIVSFWPAQYTFLGWNTANPLFAQSEVRRALTLAIDRQAMVDTLWLGHARVGSTPVPRMVWAHDASLEPWPYDPEEARRILAAQGWRDSDGDGLLDRDGRRFAFELLTNSGNRQRADAAVMIQAQLGRLGIEVSPRQLELNTVNSKLTAHDFDAFISSWTIDTSLDLSYAFHSSSITNGYNFGSYANPEVDRLIDEARARVDPEQMRSPLDRIQQILHQEQPYTFLWEPERLIGLRTRVRHATPNALSLYFDLHRWWVSGPR